MALMLGAALTLLSGAPADAQPPGHAELRPAPVRFRADVDDVRAGFQERAVDGGNCVGPAQCQQVVVAFERRTVGAEALTAKILFLQIILLDHCSHGTIEQQDPLLQLPAENRASVAVLLAAHAYRTWGAGRLARH